ncbi:MAG: NADH-ubiquinone oxidoreductase-F iron-sulfur binding region domain-containing protein [Candidatus Gygaella obscura]|nr:NADH-ubiquinone oxidoreductase-F iron-sulfur binding region domain-containing protein [Candidatus Gygaella obscura]
MSKTTSKGKENSLVIFSKIEPVSGVKRALQIGRREILDVVRDSNLKGRGGAGFPTGVKWNLAAAATSDKKYVVCNADEGEPGTFKDRLLINQFTELFLEGMIIAGFAIGAEQGFVYLRGEYKSFLPVLEKAIDSLRKSNILGKSILARKDFNFNIEVRLGVGAYVCGEETALIESLEGNRGEPRNRPPFPVNTGFNANPTIINNVETFANIPHIVTKGSKWFKSFGTEKSSGTKLLSISGDCKKPGVYEVPFGVSVKEVLKLCDAKDVKAVQVGGASGVCVSKKDFNRKISFEDLSTGGSVIVFGKKRNMLEVADNFLEFFKEESCGQCTPCREGIPVLIEALELLRKGECSKEYLKDIFSLAETMELASKCGLGQSSAKALISIINNFKDEYSLSKSKDNRKVFNG